MSIYITQQKKEELEAKIAEIENQLNSPSHFPMALSGKLLAYREILSEAIVLPVEEDWEDINFNIFSPYDLVNNYPNGVIIKSK